MIGRRIMLLADNYANGHRGAREELQKLVDSIQLIGHVRLGTDAIQSELLTYTPVYTAGPDDRNI
jgi:hypothetical protein